MKDKLKYTFKSSNDNQITDFYESIVWFSFNWSMHCSIHDKPYKLEWLDIYNKTKKYNVKLHGNIS